MRRLWRVLNGGVGEGGVNIKWIGDGLVLTGIGKERFEDHRCRVVVKVYPFCTK